MYFRHLMMITMIALVAYTVHECVEYAKMYKPDEFVAMVIGSITAPVLATLGYAMKLFLEYK